MRRSTAARAAFLLLLLAAAVLSFNFLFPSDDSRHFLGGPPLGWGYLHGYGAGMRWAVADLIHKRALVLMAGEPGESLDRETGLPLRSTGSIVGKGVLGIVDGYNRIVRSYVRSRGSPHYSLKRWDGILFNLKEYFDARAQKEPPLSLIVDGPPILAPNGKTRVWLKSRDITGDRQYELRWEPDQQTSGFWPPPKAGLLYCFTGPQGSNFLILRGSMPASDFMGLRRPGFMTEVTAAFDLQYGLLRYEESTQPNVRKEPECPGVVGTWEGTFSGQPTEPRPDGSYQETVNKFRLVLKANGTSVSGTLTVYQNRKITVPIESAECRPEGCSLELIDNNDSDVFTWFVKPRGNSLIGTRNLGSRTPMGIGTGTRLFAIRAKRVR